MMSATLNQFQIIGYLGKEPVLKQMSDGEEFTTLQVATTSRWKSLDGSFQEKIDWHTIYVFRRLATTSIDFLKRGMLLRITGSIEYLPPAAGSYSGSTFLKAKDIKHLTSNFPTPKSEAIRMNPPIIGDQSPFEVVKNGVSR